MKRSIQWHKDCLTSLTAFALRKQEAASLASKESDRIKQEVEFLKLQIRIAEETGKDGFDSELFLAKLKQQQGYSG